MQSQHFAVFRSSCFTNMLITTAVFVGILATTMFCFMTQQGITYTRLFHNCSYSLFCVTFIGIPTVHILYPIKLFRCVSCSCGSCRQHALHKFIESFEDLTMMELMVNVYFRILCAVFLILRLMMWLRLWIAIFQPDLHQKYDLQCFQLLHATLKPYRVKWSNSGDTSHKAIMFPCITDCNKPFGNKHLHLFHSDTSNVNKYTWFSSQPYSIFATHWQRGQALPHAYKNTAKHWNHDCAGCRCTRQIGTDKESQFSVGSLPDLLINPDEYEPVVALDHRKHTAAEPCQPTDTNDPVQGLSTRGKWGKLTVSLDHWYTVKNWRLI